MESTYLDIYLNEKFPNNSPVSLLSLLLLFLGRMLPIIGLSPFFGSRVLPHPVKVVFAVSLWVIFLPELLVLTETPITFNQMMIFYMAKELFIGFCLGMIVSVPFMIAQNVGMIIDHQRGGASLMVNDPTIQNQSSPIGTLFNMVLIYLFFWIDGPFHFIDAIFKSYQLIPMDKFLSEQFFTSNSPFWKQQINLFNQMMVISIQLAGPALIAILMTDVFLGIANRLAPQVQITFLGLPLKSLLALTVMAFGWKLFTEQLVKTSYLFLRMIDNAVNWLAFPGMPTAS